MHVDVKKVARIPDGGDWRAFGRGGDRSGEFNVLLESEGSRRVYTRPYSPWQNGKIERMNRTLTQEWQYACAYGSEAGRAQPSSSTIIGNVRTARAGGSRPCRASWA